MGLALSIWLIKRMGSYSLATSDLQRGRKKHTIALNVNMRTNLFHLQLGDMKPLVAESQVICCVSWAYALNKSYVCWYYVQMRANFIENEAQIVYLAMNSFIITECTCVILHRRRSLTI